MDEEIEYPVGDLNRLRKACQLADLVVLEWDGGTLIPKGAALLNDGRNHRLVSDADGDQTGEALPMPMRDTTTGRRFRVVQLACEDEDHAVEIVRWVERVNA